MTVVARLVPRALALFVVVPGIASAFGPGGHFGAAEDSFDQVAALPGNQALRGDDTARHCYLYGANIPDLAWIYQRLSLFNTIQDKVGKAPGVKSVNIDTTDVGPFNIPHHDQTFLLHLVDRARATGSKELLAFALGALAHSAEDYEEETFAMLRTTLEARVGDLSLESEASHDPARFTERDECEAVISLVREHTQSSDRLQRLRDLPTELVPGGFLGLQRTARSLALRSRLVAFYYDEARQYALQGNASLQPISARGVMNAAGLMEASWVLLPAAVNRASFGETARVFKSRYVDLKWWADILVFLGDALSRALTLGTQGVYDVAALCLHPRKIIGNGLAAADDPLQQVVVASMFGGDLWRAAEQRYGGLSQFQRMVRGNMLDTAKQDTTAISTAITVDLARRGSASLWTHWVSPIGLTMRGVAHQVFSIGQPLPAPPQAPSWYAVWQRAAYNRDLAAYHARWDHSFEARAAGFVVADLRWKDAATGADVAQVGAADQGRRIRAEVVVQGLNPRAAWLYQGAPLPFEAVLLEDVVGGPDRELAHVAVSMPADEIDPLKYGEHPMPVLTLEAPLPITAGTAGYHVEVRYDGHTVFTTDMDAVIAQGASEAQYRTWYGSYTTNRRIHGLPIR
jgi:hypothetical protein